MVLSEDDSDSLEEPPQDEIDRDPEEERVLKAAAAIQFQAGLTRGAGFRDPERNTTHWDQLLSEMKWMSDDFARERKWRLNQAKIYARRAVRGLQEAKIKESHRQKDEVFRKMKICAAISQEVQKFWRKAERVVNFKVQQTIEWRKKEMLDKHLDFLVGQTERYSTMLAENLLQAQEIDSIENQQDTQPVPGPLSKMNVAEPLKNNIQASRDHIESQVQDSRPSKRLKTGKRTIFTRTSYPDSSHKSQGIIGTASLGNVEDDGSDVISDSDSQEYVNVPEEQDDEATLEQQELVEAAENQPNQYTNELNTLAGEAFLPLDEILKGYGVAVTPDCRVERCSSPVSIGPGESDKEQADTGEKGKHDSSFLEDMEQELESCKDERADNATAALFDPGGRSGEPSVPSKPQTGQSGSLNMQFANSATGLQVLLDEKDDSDGEFLADMMDTDDLMDDERTLEAEEELEAAEGAIDKAAELVNLSEEADMPLEKLLERYKMMASENGNLEHMNSKLRICSPKADDNATGHGMCAKDMDVVMADNYPSPSKGYENHAESSKQAEAADDSCEIPTPCTKSKEVNDNHKAHNEEEKDPERASDENLEEIAMAASSAQPVGNTLSSCDVRTNVPFLLKHTLREYQHIGLDWLVTLYKKRINGILADEMGLGKTIQTISLLGWLACEEGVWGPHLIVVPTSVMLNWEMEFKKWCPAFKLLTYYGNAKERRAKRQGWSKPNTFHVCITSYTLILQDAKMFRRKKWKYLILDEAHMIKNWKSQRWQTLLNFNSKRRLLLTGTPLQNDLMELWSLMHFLMPHVFSSHAQFKDWFCNPLTGMVQGQSEVNQNIVERLHGVLRPFLLRRLKAEVERQLPQKHQHTIYCRLSKRQRKLYEEYMASSDTKYTLASGGYLGMINVLMQLRKVCNHPDLFAGRPIVSSWDVQGVEMRLPPLCVDLCGPGLVQGCSVMRYLLPSWNENMAKWEASDIRELETPTESLVKMNGNENIWDEARRTISKFRRENVSEAALDVLMQSMQKVNLSKREWRQSRIHFFAQQNRTQCCQSPIYGLDLRAAVRCWAPLGARKRASWCNAPDALNLAVKSYEQRSQECDTMLKVFLCHIPKARTSPPALWCAKPTTLMLQKASWQRIALEQEYRKRSNMLWTASIRRQLFFPDKRLVQFDCGKLQELAVLMHKLRSGGHRVLIFTQMSKMLDVLEVFLNIHGFTYMRLDGSTKPEQRQILMQKFNNDSRTFAFILSTRSGGVGVNLTGADTVIFYDSDWNPAMDLQAQDRCHRIGQTREVHIYRLVTQHTIEENILRKSDEKRHLDFLAIQSGDFNLDFLQKLSPRDLLGVPSADEIRAAMQSAEDEADAAAAVEAEKEAADELAEFTVEPPPAAINPNHQADLDADNDADNLEDIPEQQDEKAGTDDASSMDKVEKDDEVGSVKDDEIKKEDGEAMDRGEPDQEDAEDGVGNGQTCEEAVNTEEEEGFGGLNQGMVGSEQMAQLLEQFTPIEKFAIRAIEDQINGSIDIEAAAHQLMANVKEEEWELDAIEEKKEQEDHEIDMEDEGWVDVWDKAAATMEYKTEVEAAQKLAEEEKKKMEEYLLYLASLPPEPDPEPPKPPKRPKAKDGQSRPPKRQRSPQSRSSSSLSSSSSDDDDNMTSKWRKLDHQKPRAPRTLNDTLWDRINPSFFCQPQPWKVEDDLVLGFMVKHASEGLIMEGKFSGKGLVIPEGVWVAAAEALERGASCQHVDFEESEPATTPVRRTAKECKMRYSQLLMSCANSSVPDVLGIPQRQCVMSLRASHNLLLSKIAEFVSTSKDMQDVTALWQQLACAAGTKTLPECIQHLMRVLRETAWPDAPQLPSFNLTEGLFVTPLASEVILSTVMQFHGERGTKLNKRLVGILSDLDKVATSGELQQALRITLKGSKPKKDIHPKTTVSEEQVKGMPRPLEQFTERPAASGSRRQVPDLLAHEKFLPGSSLPTPGYQRSAWGGPTPIVRNAAHPAYHAHRPPASAPMFPLPLRRDFARGIPSTSDRAMNHIPTSAPSVYLHSRPVQYQRPVMYSYISPRPDGQPYPMLHPAPQRGEGQHSIPQQVNQAPSSVTPGQLDQVMKRLQQQQGTAPQPVFQYSQVVRPPFLANGSNWQNSNLPVVSIPQPSPMNQVPQMYVCQSPSIPGNSMGMMTTIHQVPLLRPPDPISHVRASGPSLTNLSSLPMAHSNLPIGISMRSTTEGAPRTFSQPQPVMNVPGPSTPVILPQSGSPWQGRIGTTWSTLQVAAPQQVPNMAAQHELPEPLATKLKEMGLQNVSVRDLGMQQQGSVVSAPLQVQTDWKPQVIATSSNPVPPGGGMRGHIQSTQRLAVPSHTLSSHSLANRQSFQAMPRVIPGPFQPSVPTVSKQGPTHPGGTGGIWQAQAHPSVLVTSNAMTAGAPMHQVLVPISLPLLAAYQSQGLGLQGLPVVQVERQDGAAAEAMPGDGQLRPTPSNVDPSQSVPGV